MLHEPDFRSSSSLGEKRMNQLTRPGVRSAAVATYSKRHLLRAYPRGRRIDSSNYDPTPAWNAGKKIFF